MHQQENKKIYFLLRHKYYLILSFENADFITAIKQNRSIVAQRFSGSPLYFRFKMYLTVSKLTHSKKKITDIHKE